MTASLPIATDSNTTQEFVTVRIDDQLLGISVYYVQDVLAPCKVITIPLSPPEVVGSLNLRGRIVTAIDLRVRLGMQPLPDRENRKSIVVECRGVLYSLVVDSVGDVLTLPMAEICENPNNMTPKWREVSKGVFSLENDLLVILDVEMLLNFSSHAPIEAVNENLSGS